MERHSATEARLQSFVKLDGRGETASFYYASSTCGVKVSDGMIILSLVSGLAVLFSATRVIVAYIQRGGNSNLPPAIEARLGRLEQRISEIEEEAELRAAELARVADAQAFLTRLIADGHNPSSLTGSKGADSSA